MKAAFADRKQHLGDPDFVGVPLEWMVSKERAREWWEQIDGDKPIRVSFTPPEHPDTTQVTVVDAQGNCVSGGITFRGLAPTAIPSRPLCGLEPAPEGGGRKSLDLAQCSA